MDTFTEGTIEDFIVSMALLNQTMPGIKLTDEGIIIPNCSDWFDQRNTSKEVETQLTDDQKQTLARVYYCLYTVVIPVVCVFGFFGNILNIAVFSKKKMCKTLDDIEYCTTIFLIALAVSDLMFCTCTFPNAFVQSKTVYSKSDFQLYYKMYSVFAINTFIMSSTLLTVFTAIMRYTAICHPFHSRQFISFKKTIVAIIVVFVFSAGFNAPVIWRVSMEEINCLGKDTYVELKSKIFKDVKIVYIHKLLWAVVGNFLPLILLLYCNIRLVKALHASQQLRLLHSRDNAGCLSAHRRINITLITIIILFFLLVAPSEIAKFISYVPNSDSEYAKNSYTYVLVSMITNTLQCINFSVNFVLYYIIIAPFRKTLHEFVCILKTRRGTRDSTNSQKQTCIVLTLKEQRRALL